MMLVVPSAVPYLNLSDAEALDRTDILLVLSESIRGATAADLAALVQGIQRIVAVTAPTEQKSGQPSLLLRLVQSNDYQRSRFFDHRHLNRHRLRGLRTRFVDRQVRPPIVRLSQLLFPPLSQEVTPRIRTLSGVNLSVMMRLSYLPREQIT